MIHESDDEDNPLLEDIDVPREAWDTPPVSADFREAVLFRTSAVLRARKRYRHVAVAGALVAASYVGGVATTWFALRPAAPAATPERAVAETWQIETAAPVAEPVVTDALLQDPEGLALLLARSPLDEQLKILKVAGDRYLEGFGDVDQAMNCYRRLLALQQPSADIAMKVDDSWLLMSMKQARLQEVDHEDATT